jgi:hypothetical protein
MRKALVVFFVAAFVGVVACGGSKGDSCDEEGKVQGECDEGLVCAHSKDETTGSLECLTQCDTQINCQAGENCVGVGNTSLKACRPR